MIENMCRYIALKRLEESSEPCCKKKSKAMKKEYVVKHKQVGIHGISIADRLERKVRKKK